MVQTCMESVIGVKLNTKDGGTVEMGQGCIDTHLISVTHLNTDQEQETTQVHMSNTQAFKLAMYILHNTEVMVRS